MRATICEMCGKVMLDAEAGWAYGYEVKVYLDDGEFQFEVCESCQDHLIEAVEQKRKEIREQYQSGMNWG